MSRRLATRLLWLVLVLCVPVPFFLVETGQAPAAALLQMLSVVLLLIATEGGEGAVSLIAAILAAQAVFAMIVLGLIATATMRITERLAGPRGLTAVLVLATILAVAAFFLPVYRTPFRAGGLHSTLIEAFE